MILSFKESHNEMLIWSILTQCQKMHETPAKVLNDKTLH